MIIVVIVQQNHPRFTFFCSYFPFTLISVTYAYLQIGRPTLDKELASIFITMGGMPDEGQVRGIVERLMKDADLETLTGECHARLVGNRYDLVTVRMVQEYMM